MDNPTIIRQRIVKFLLDLPNIHDSQSQQAFLHSAELDEALLTQLPVGTPLKQFVEQLILMCIKYGTLHDGRHALEAVLEAAKNYVGQDKRAYCDTLIHGAKTSLISRTADVPPVLNGIIQESQEAVKKIDISDKEITGRTFWDIIGKFTKPFQPRPYHFLTIALIIFFAGWGVAHWAAAPRQEVTVWGLFHYTKPPVPTPIPTQTLTTTPTSTPTVMPTLIPALTEGERDITDKRIYIVASGGGKFNGWVINHNGDARPTQLRGGNWTITESLNLTQPRGGSYPSGANFSIHRESNGRYTIRVFDSESPFNGWVLNYDADAPIVHNGDWLESYNLNLTKPDEGIPEGAYWKITAYESERYTIQATGSESFEGYYLDYNGWADTTSLRSWTIATNLKLNASSSDRISDGSFWSFKYPK